MRRTRVPKTDTEVWETCGEATYCLDATILGFGPDKLVEPTLLARTGRLSSFGKAWLRVQYHRPLGPSDPSVWTT